MYLEDKPKLLFLATSAISQELISARYFICFSVHFRFLRPPTFTVYPFVGVFITAAHCIFALVYCIFSSFLFKLLNAR